MATDPGMAKKGSLIRGQDGLPVINTRNAVPRLSRYEDTGAEGGVIAIREILQAHGHDLMVSDPLYTSTVYRAGWVSIVNGSLPEETRACHKSIPPHRPLEP